MCVHRQSDCAWSGEKREGACRVEAGDLWLDQIVPQLDGGFM